MHRPKHACFPKYHLVVLPEARQCKSDFTLGINKVKIIIHGF